MFNQSDKRLYELRRDSSSETMEAQKEESVAGVRIKEHYLGTASSDDPIQNSGYINENNMNQQPYFPDGKTFQDSLISSTVDTIRQTNIDTTARNLLNIPNESSVDDDDVITAQDMTRAANMFSVEEIHKNRFNKFSRYGILDPAHEFTGGREYLFFSKPDLHIFDPMRHQLNPELQRVPFFINALEQYPESLYSLQQTYNYASSEMAGIPNSRILKNKFIPLLSNQVTSSLDLPGISATETANNSNLYQIGTTYRDGSEISDCSYEFTLEFHDTRYLDVYMFFKAYDEYFRQKYLKNIVPVNLNYIDNRVDPNSFSIWKLIVDETNTIVYWAKAIAVTPMSVPRDAISNLETPIRETISFKAQFVRDMNPVSLMELNHLSALTLGITEESINKTIFGSDYYTPNTVSKKRNLSVIPLYDEKGHVANTEWGTVPYIIKRYGTKRHYATDVEKEFYRLVWLKTRF